MTLKTFVIDPEWLKALRGLKRYTMLCTDTGKKLGLYKDMQELSPDEESPFEPEYSAANKSIPEVFIESVLQQELSELTAYTLLCDCTGKTLGSYQPVREGEIINLESPISVEELERRRHKDRKIARRNVAEIGAVKYRDLKSLELIPSGIKSIPKPSESID